MKVLIWDLSGVLIIEKPVNTYEFAASCGLSSKRWREIDTDFLINKKRWGEVEKGKLSLEQFCIELSNEIKRKGGECSILKASTIWGTPNPFACGNGERKRLISFIRSLKGQILNCLATNNIKEWREIWINLVPIDDFRYIFDSSSMGVRKPESEFWEIIENTVYEETEMRNDIILVDDSLENCISAVSYGWNAIQFKDEETVKEEILKILNHK